MRQRVEGCKAGRQRAQDRGGTEGCTEVTKWAGVEQGDHSCQCVLYSAVGCSLGLGLALKGMCT